MKQTKHAARARYNNAHNGGNADISPSNTTALAVYPLDEGAGLSVKLDGETVWLTQKQMAVLFGCDRANITQHLRGIFADGELDASATCKDFLQVQIEGGREVSRDVTHYNLDAVISVGFRVNSRRGIAFRQWANKVIKDRMLARLAPSAIRLQRRREFAGLVPEILAPVLVTARGGGAGDVANIQAEAKGVA